MLDLEHQREGQPCTCGERREALETSTGLWCCIACGTPASYDHQPSHEAQLAIIASYRTGGRPPALASEHAGPHGVLAPIAREIAQTWEHYLLPEIALEAAREALTPLAFDDPSTPPLAQIATSVLHRMRATRGLAISDRLIGELATTAQDVHRRRMS